MGFTFFFFTALLYLAWFTWPLKSISSEEVLKSAETTKNSAEPAEDTAITLQCNKPVSVIGSNENNLYLYKVLNKRVLNDFVMVKKKAFYVTPPFEPYRVTQARHEPAEIENDLKKNRLEQFTMRKKEAFYITPPFDYETVTPKPDTDQPEKSSDSSSEKENKDEEIEEKKENLSAKDKDINPGDSKEKQEEPEPVRDAQDLHNSDSKMANGSVSNTDQVAAKSYDYDITFTPNADQFETSSNQQADADQKVIQDLTSQQGEIMRRFNNLAADKDKVENYKLLFDNLMKEIQRQRASASSTVMFMVDENEVKNKLRADPFVQRVLKMAKRRKDEYFRRAHEEALQKV